MSLNYDHPKCVVCVCGKGGHGKSTLYKKILDSQRAKYWFYYDHKSEFSTRFGLQPCFDLEGIAAQLAATGVVCFDPSKMYSGAKEDGFLFFCDFVYEISGQMEGRKILVCDELHMMSFQGRPTELVAIMDDGRSREIDCFFITQSTNQLHNNIQNQFTEIYTFRQDTGAATDHLVNVGFDENEILDLKPGEFLWLNLTSGEARRGGTSFKIKSTANPDLFTSTAREVPKGNRGRPKNKPAHR